MIVRVVPDVAGLDGKRFDYVVPERLRDHVRVGSVVRVELHGRRVRAWVVAVDVEAPAGVSLKPILKVSPGATTSEVVALAEWAAWRWAGRLVHVLDTASGASARLARGEWSPESGVTVVRVPPGVEPPAVEGALVVRGRRSSVWAPAPGARAVVVVDEHDEGLQEERMPTWHAREVAIERARRAAIPCVLVSPCPSLEALAAADRVIEPTRDDERAGWPVLDVVDRRKEDPRSGLYSERLVQAIRRAGDREVLAVLNRKGRSRLLACATCGAVATCERCGAAVTQPAEVLHCVRCGTERPVVCLACGSTVLKNLRVGVGRAQEELDALVGSGRVAVGTEAVLHEPHHDVGLVAFLDFDQELLAPRYRAAEEAMALLARAARLLGPRARGGRLLVQTREPKHPVLDAVLHADPSRAVTAERDTRRGLKLPPFVALAAVSGAAADAFVDPLRGVLGIEVLGPSEGTYLVRAADHRTLCDALAAADRPPGRLRIEVDPPRV